jgi:predicted RNA-binding protein associated with RNAse of E/G family
MPPPDALPEITEVKETLAGTRKTFLCHVIERREGALVVLFVSKAAVRVHDLELPAGTVTFGHFWEGRAFNVYHWMTPSGPTLAFYVNLAESTAIDPRRLFWRDLTIDILIPPLGEPVVLDEDELPAGLDEAARARIEGAKREVLARAADLRIELEAAADRLWPRVFGEERRR